MKDIVIKHENTRLDGKVVEEGYVIEIRHFSNSINGLGIVLSPAEHAKLREALKQDHQNRKNKKLIKLEKIVNKVFSDTNKDTDYTRGYSDAIGDVLYRIAVLKKCDGKKNSE
jgi:hypothetical protein